MLILKKNIRKKDQTLCYRRKDKNAYVHRNQIMIIVVSLLDRVADKRYRMVLTDPATGKHPPNT